MITDFASGGRIIGARSEFGRRLFQIAFAVMPLFCGVFLQYVSFGKFGHFLNLPWGWVFGAALFLTDVLFGNSRDAPWILGDLLLWPIFLAIVFYWASGKLWQRVGTPTRWVLVALLILSVFAIVPAEAKQIRPYVIPTYGNEFAVFW